MKSEYLLLWLAGGVVVFLAIHAFLFLKKVCEARHDAEHEEFYQFLLYPDVPHVPKTQVNFWLPWSNPIKALQQALSERSDAA